jgi:hypothetical protein
MAITFDPTIGSRLNICTSFMKPFSLGLLWNRNSVTRRPSQPEFSNGWKWPYHFYSTVGMLSNFCTSFQRPFSLGFLCNRYSVTRRSIRPDLSNGLKWPLFFIPPLDRAQMFSQVFGGRFPWVAIESLLGDEEVWSARIVQRVKMAIIFDPTVG